jgi:phosphate starvation-inducible PhoH-like protein
VETVLEFPDNRLLIDLCGEFDRNLAQIEHQMGVHILRRGNRLAVIGDKGERATGGGGAALALCPARIGARWSAAATSTAQCAWAAPGEPAEGASRSRCSEGGRAWNCAPARSRSNPGPRRRRPMSPTCSQNELGFGIGPAGTGKTYLAVAVGVTMFIGGRMSKRSSCRARRSRRANGWASCPAT